MRPQDGQRRQPSDITEEDEREAVWRLHAAGKSAAAIARVREISAYRVRRLIKAAKELPPVEIAEEEVPAQLEETMARWTDEEWRFRMEGLAQRALLAAEEILDDERTSTSMRMQLIKIALAYKTPKDDSPDRAIHIHLNGRQQESMKAVIEGEFTYRPTHLIAETE